MATTIHQHSDIAIVGTETLYDSDSIKQSILTLLKTQKGERLFRPNTGSDLESILWQPMSDSTANDLKTEIIATIQQDPRCVISELEVTADASNYCYNVYLSVLVNGVESQVELQLKKKGL